MGSCWAGGVENLIGSLCLWAGPVPSSPLLGAQNLPVTRSVWLDVSLPAPGRETFGYPGQEGHGPDLD